MLYQTIILAVVIGLLLIWAIIATTCALNNSKEKTACNNSLSSANSQIDSCNKYCGSKGNWAPGQVTLVQNDISSLVPHLNNIVCAKPSTDYPALTSCSVTTLAQQNSFWDISNQNNILQSAAIITGAAIGCIPSVPGCKIIKS